MGSVDSAPILPLFALATVATALNTVYFKCMMNCYKGDPSAGELHDYATFVSVFDILLWAAFMSAVARLGGWKRSARRFGPRDLLRAAGADQLCTLLATVGAPHVPGQAQVLLNQSVLPLTMLLSLVLGRRYSAAEAIGAGLVLAGASVAAVSQTSPSVPGGRTTAALEDGAVPSAEALRMGVVLFSLAQLAAAGAGLVKEVLLRQDSFEPAGDPIALGVAIAWLRVPLGVALALAFRAREGSSALAEFRDGWRCFCGAQPRPGDVACARAARNTLLSVALYAAQTLLGLRLTQRSSATLKSIATVTAVPVAQFLLTSELLMTETGAEAYGSGSAVGLGLCLAGFYFYLSGKRSLLAEGSKERHP